MSTNPYSPSTSPKPAAALPQMTGLKTLDLRENCRIGPKGAAALAPALAQMTGLERLDLWYNCIGPEAEATLRAAWEKAGKDASKLKV